MQVSGKFTTGVRVDSLGKVEGKSADRPTGMHIPIKRPATSRALGY